MIKIIKLMLALCLGLLITGPGIAQQKDDPCAHAISQPEINDCAAQRYKKADAALNQVYKQVMKRLDNEDEKATLKKGETAWIKYRDAHCEAETSGSPRGSIYPLEYYSCLITVTAARTKKLKQMLKDISQR